MSLPTCLLNSGGAHWSYVIVDCKRGLLFNLHNPQRNNIPSCLISDHACLFHHINSGYVMLCFPCAIYQPHRKPRPPPAIAYMTHHNKEMLQEVQKEQDIGSCEQWLNIKNDQDYLHPVEKKPGRLRVRPVALYLKIYVWKSKFHWQRYLFSSMSHHL